MEHRILLPPHGKIPPVVVRPQLHLAYPDVREDHAIVLRVAVGAGIEVVTAVEVPPGLSVSPKGHRFPSDIDRRPLPLAVVEEVAVLPRVRRVREVGQEPLVELERARVLLPDLCMGQTIPLPVRAQTQTDGEAHLANTKGWQREKRKMTK